MTLQLPPSDVETRPEPAPPAKRTSRVLIVLLSLLVLVTGALALAVWAAGQAADEAVTLTEEVLAPILPEPIAKDGAVVIEAIIGMSELTTAEAAAFVTVERGVDAGLLNWATGEKIGLLAVANVGAGIDLSEIDPGDVLADPMTGEITIQLPPAVITYVDIDEAASEVYDRDLGIFVNPDPALEQEARLAAEGLLEEKAIEAGVLDQATDRAISVVEGLAEAFGYETITVLP